MNLPNRLTVARLFMVPVFVVLMSIEHVLSHALAYIVFIVASYTDYLDGQIARKHNLITNFGKLLDPLADKILLAAAFVMLMKVPSLNIPGWTIVAILAREFLVTGARAMAASEGVVIAANRSGKAKTITQMIYIYTFLFFAMVEEVALRWAPGYAESYLAILKTTSLWAIIFVSALTVYSGIQFARDNWRTLQLGSQT